MSYQSVHFCGAQTVTGCILVGIAWDARPVAHTAPRSRLLLYSRPLFFVADRFDYLSFYGKILII